jgi:putative peptidoglycan lipid II flippase
MQDNQQATSHNQQQGHKHIVKSATYMAMGTFSSRLLGLVRDAILGAFFSRTVTDAWLVAFRLPNMLRRLFGEGALSVSFIPIFIELMTNPKSKQEGKDFRLACGIFSLLTLILTVLTTLGIILSPYIVHLIAGEEAYMAIPGKFEMTVKMAQIMFLFCFFICMYAFFMAILNAYKKFALAAFAPVLFNIAMIISTLLPAYFPEHFSNLQLAWGVTIGGFLQMIILVPALIKLKCLPKFSLNFFDSNVLRVFRNMVPGLLGLGVMQIGLIINTRFAASLEEGANSWIYWADRVLELPLSLFAVSLGTALLPTLSAHWSRNEKVEMVETANRYLRMIFFVSVPCALGVWFLSRPIVEVLFLRGKFSEYDVMNTASVLMIYSVGILSFGGIRVIAPSFYAIKNTYYPAVVSSICLTVHYFVAQYLMKHFGIKGLASSSMISSGLNFVLLLAGFQMLVGNLMLGKLLKSVAKFFLAGAVMVGVIQAYDPLIHYFGTTFFVRLIVLMIIIILSVSVYFGITSVLKTEEYELVFSNLQKKIFGKFSRKKLSV